MRQGIDDLVDADVGNAFAIKEVGCDVHEPIARGRVLSYHWLHSWSIQNSLSNVFGLSFLGADDTRETCVTDIRPHRGWPEIWMTLDTATLRA